MHPSALGTPTNRLFSLEHQLAPLALQLRWGARHCIVIGSKDGVTTDNFAENLHPALLLLSAVGVKVDQLAVIEANSEPFLDKHVAFFVLGERRTTALSVLAGNLLLHEGTAIIDKPLGIREVDGCSWLSS